jgi:hypothetical protein
MQEKEMMTQPRTDTAVLIKACRALESDCDVANLASITIHFNGDIKSDQAFENSVLSQIADRLEEQEATIRHLRVELCNASAVAMEHLGTVKTFREEFKTFREEIDLLNRRPKR